MDKLGMRLAAVIMCSAWIATAGAQTGTLGSCVTRTVNANYAGATWMAQQVCQSNEVAVSANGFCSQAGRMVGASTTSGTADRSVWLWCSQSGPAVWYAMCPGGHLNFLYPWPGQIPPGVAGRCELLS